MWILFIVCLVVPGFAVSQKNDRVCSRKCFVNGIDKGANWSEPNYNGCFDKEYSELLGKVKDTSVAMVADTSEIQTNVTDTSEIPTNVTEIVRMLLDLTNTSEGPNPGNHSATVMFMLIKRLLAVVLNGSTDNITEAEIESGSNNSSNKLHVLRSEASISLSEKEIESIGQLNKSQKDRWQAIVKANWRYFQPTLDTIMKKEKTTFADIVLYVIRNLLVLTNKSEGLSPGNLNASIMIINHVAVLLSNNTISLNQTVVESVVQIVSNVLQSNNTDAWKTLNDVDKTISTSILFSTDVFGQIISTSNVPGHKRVHTENLVLEAWSVETSSLPLQIEFPNNTVLDEDRGDGIAISIGTLNNSISSKSQPILNMWGTYFRTINDQLQGHKRSDDVVNSRILSFSIDGLSANQALNPPVTVTLRHRPTEEKWMSFQRKCAFWNFERGDWDSTGCSVMSTNSTHTICSCDHLTNFAILMSRKPSYDKSLSIISIIGCSISVTGLILTIIVYGITWKHAKSSQATILLNLCVALVIAYIIFMAGADKVDSEVSCKVVAALLHYFLLVAFFIMLAEGIDMVLNIFFVFHVRRTRETIMLVASAWVLPLIIVGVSLGVTKFEGYGHENACWLSVKKGLIWAFAGPVLCIVAVNLVILIIILRLISKKKSLLAKNARRDEIRATIWNLSVTCPVLGIGWLFGAFSVAFKHVAFQYVFVIINSLHGLLIFIIYALFHNKKMNEKISTVYLKYIGRCRKTDPSVSTKRPASQEPSISSTGNTQMTSALDQSRSSTSNIQMYSVQEKSTITSAPADGVLAATQMTSAPGQSISPKPDYDSMANIQLTSEP